MASKGGKSHARRGHEEHHAQWKGDAVQDQHGDAAERGAERAAGNEPVRAEDESRRIHTLGASEEPGEPRRTAPPPDRPSDDEEIEDVAEEHRAQRAGGERPLGKL
jgi:hypothetical protein